MNEFELLPDPSVPNDNGRRKANRSYFYSPSPFLHELTKRIKTPSGRDYDGRTLFIRRSERIRIAMEDERLAIRREKEHFQGVRYRFNQPGDQTIRAQWREIRASISMASFPDFAVERNLR